MVYLKETLLLKPISVSMNGLKAEKKDKKQKQIKTKQKHQYPRAYYKEDVEVDG